LMRISVNFSVEVSLSYPAVIFNIL
jgi:hypothetical protein